MDRKNNPGNKDQLRDRVYVYQELAQKTISKTKQLLICIGFPLVEVYGKVAISRVDDSAFAIFETFHDEIRLKKSLCTWPGEI